MSWPQITIIVLWAMGLTIHALKHGQPMGKYHFVAKAVAVCIMAALLTAGGFFK